jgi:phosphoglycolate phosphatase
MSVFLDLDGTLTNPAEGICGSMADALAALDLPVPEDPVAELAWAIGPPLIDSFAKLGAPDPAAALAQYRRSYQSGGMFKAHLYPGIPEALGEMAAKTPLYLATAKPHAYAVKITAHFGLAPHLSQQFGPELDGTRNDKAELLAYACDTLGIDPTTAVMVGDRAMDARAARANGMGFVGVRWGFGAPEELKGADRFCHHARELPAAVAAVAAAMLGERHV